MLACWPPLSLERFIEITGKTLPGHAFENVRLVYGIDPGCPAALTARHFKQTRSPGGLEES